MSIIAIDFGTSNTVVSILEADTKEANTIRFPELSRLFTYTDNNGENKNIAVTPTLIFIKEGNQIVLGEKVRSQRLGLAKPQRLFKAFKRDLAADFQGLPRQLDNESYTSKTVSEIFIKEIWEKIKEQNIQPSKVFCALTHY